MRIWSVALAGLLASASFAAGSVNLALTATARSWEPNAVASVPCALVNDGDALTFWGSNEPTTDPPKDIGLEWPAPQRLCTVVARFHSLGYVPAADGWKLQARRDGQWADLPAIIENPDCEWWTLRFPPVETTAVRLLVTRYALQRVAVAEFEAYDGEPARPALRRAPLLDGAFWAFHYENWAQHYATDAALAAEVDRAHAAGLDLIILYTITGADGVFSTAVPGTNLPQSPWWQGRDPVEAILARADTLGMQVYLSDTSPDGFDRPVATEQAAAVTQTLTAYRRQSLARYQAHPSLTGYYINYECCPDNFGNDPAEPARLAQELAALVKAECPRLRVVQPVGLYGWRESPNAPWATVTPDPLERFWRPFMQATPDVDAFMVIDGVGTGLAPLNYTDANQARLRALCEETGKAMWTDVELAVMGDKYESMSLGRVAASLEVAARHADTIVGFCYINYMSPANGRELSARLYRDYQAYRLGVRATARD